MASKPKFKPLATSRVIELEDFASSIGDSAWEGDSVSLDKILEEQEIELYCDDFGDDFEGLIELNDDLFIIYLNNALGNDPNSPRGRFSIAHELGHFFIDEHRLAITQKRMPSLGDYSEQDLEIEREADLFASRLLLPKDQFTRAIKKVDKGLEGIRELAKKFRVSIKCAALRYLSEEPMPCALIFRSIDGSVKWKLFSKGMWNAGFRSINEEPVAGGATQLCIKGKEADWTSAPASYLFRLPDQCHANVVFIEEAMHLGDFGILTLLRCQEPKLQTMADVLDRRYAR